MSIFDRRAPTPDAVLRYDDRPDAVIDVYLPDVPASTVVTYLHGGFWREAYDRRHARPLARALADDGQVVLLPEFRRVGGGGGWPVTCDDVALAFARIPELLPLVDVRLERHVLTGHSAGGHLTLWLVAQGVSVDLAVAIAPVGDLRAAAAIGMGNGAVDDFLGGTAPVDAADPAVLLARRRPAYPVRIVHGTADDSVTIENSRGLVARYPWIDLLELDGVDHFDPIDPTAAAFAAVTTALA